MTRRIVRTGLQLASLLAIFLVLVFVLDNRYAVLPTSIHNHLPAHHPGLIITDITISSCTKLSSCKLDPRIWHRIEKDLYLNRKWLSHAYVHIQRKKEEELTAEDKVIMDVRVGRLDPGIAEKDEQNAKWESRSGGIWIKRSSKRGDSDSKKAVTAVDVLYGSDAVEPRPGWEIRDTALNLGAHDPRLSIRRGAPVRVEKPELRIRKDGKLKIMQVSDLHLSTGLGLCRDPEPKGANGGRCEADPRTLEFVGKLLDQEKPDLVVLSGDQVNGETSPDAQSAIFKFAELFIKRRIPYATIYGNHDDEGSLTRSATMSLTQSLPYSLSAPGPNTIDGVGNYYVEVLAANSKHSALTLYLLDTHGYSPDEKMYRGYDWLKPSQIKWFKDTAQSLRDSELHKGYRLHHLDMAFIHIPLPEYRDQYPEPDLIGERREGVTAPGFNTHFVDALISEKVPVVSCGHDHANDYCALSRDEGSNPQLWMCYAGGSGFGGYGGYGGYQRRVRVWEIDANEAKIETWKRVECCGPDVEKEVDRQTIVEGGKVVAAA